MHTALILLSLFAIDSLAIVSPGPSILLVVHAAAERRRRDALLIALGLAASGALWASIAVTGLTAIFDALPALQTVIRMAGAAYLLHLAWRLWRSRPEGTAPPAAAAASPALPVHKALLRGATTSLLNPKSLAYFGSIFVLLIPADAGGPLRAAAVGLVFFDALLWYGLAAWLFSTPRVIRGYMSLRRPIDRACAGLMTAFGIKLML